jgi:hypothetical protein
MPLRARARSVINTNQKENVVTDTATPVLPREPFRLAAGAHGSTFSGEACWNELGTILAGEPFGDSPRCFSPVIRRFGMALNDRLDDDRRQLLRPFALRALGTAGDGRDQERGEMCREWLLHNALPDLLDKAGEQEAAQKLRDLPDDLAIDGVLRALREARATAWNAREAAVSRLREQILGEMKKAGWKAVAAGAAEAAEAAGAAGAAEAAGAAVAAGAAGAAGAAEAAGAAGAAVAAGAAGAAEAAEAAGAAGAAEAAEAAVFKAGSKDWWRVRDAVYNAVYPKLREAIAPQFDELLASGLELLDRMLPENPVMEPVVDYADIVCAAPAELAA